MEYAKQLLISALALFTSACQTGVLAWNEEAKLSDNSIILTTRTVAFKYFQPIGGGGGAEITNSSLKIASGANAPHHIWSHPPLIPLLLDKDANSNEWLIVATFLDCETWEKLGRPKLPYIEFRYRKNNWQQTPLSPSLIGKQTNLIMPDRKRASQDQTIESKSEIERKANTLPEFRQISSKWVNNC